MLQFVSALHGLFVDEQEDRKGCHGQGLVEYALIIAFIAVVVIVAMTFLQGRISALFSNVGNSLGGDATAGMCPPGTTYQTISAYNAAMNAYNLGSGPHPGAANYAADFQYCVTP